MSDYFALCDKYSHLEKTMLTFTSNKKGTYTKLRQMNEIKTYITYLIANSPADIYFFTNIEIGNEFSNPHIHTQIWSNDIKAVELIRSKVISKYGLVNKRCSMSVSANKNIKFYDYAVKDYNSKLSDDKIWKIEMAKKRMRKQLGLKVRFYSKSKSKYTSKLYKAVYHSYGVLRKYADDFIEFIVKFLFLGEADRDAVVRGVSRFEFVCESSFITIRERELLFCNIYAAFLFLGFQKSFYDSICSTAPP